MTSAVLLENRPALHAPRRDRDEQRVPCGPAVDRKATTSRSRRGRWLIAVGVLAAVATAVVLTLELRDADLGSTLARTDPRWVAVAVGVFALSILSAAYNLIGFSALRLRLGDTLLAQLAVGGLRVITPSAISTPAIATRYLVRSGASTPDALATVGAAQTAQLLATTVVVAALAGVSGPQQVATPSPVGVLIGAGAVVSLVLVAIVVARRSAHVGRALAGARESVAGLVEHARRRPGQVIVGMLASALLTLTHVLAFAACVIAVGGHASLLTLCAIYLGAAAAGSLIPTPSGIGAVEAALIAGLVATGVGVPAATAAALLSRLVSVWAPALPGWFALVALRRRCLL